MDSASGKAGKLRWGKYTKNPETPGKLKALRHRPASRITVISRGGGSYALETGCPFPFSEALPVDFLIFGANDASRLILLLSGEGNRVQVCIAGTGRGIY